MSAPYLSNNVEFHQEEQQSGQLWQDNTSQESKTNAILSNHGNHGLCHACRDAASPDNTINMQHKITGDNLIKMLSLLHWSSRALYDAIYTHIFDIPQNSKEEIEESHYYQICMEIDALLDAVGFMPGDEASDVGHDAWEVDDAD